MGPCLRWGDGKGAGVTEWEIRDRQTSRLPLGRGARGRTPRTKSKSYFSGMANSESGDSVLCTIVSSS